MNFHRISLACLMVIISTIYSEATSPIPTNPAIKIKITSKGLDTFSSGIMRKLKFKQEYGMQYPIEFKLDEQMFEGTAKLVSSPSIETIPIPNVKETESYEGYERVHVDTRVKREVSPTHAKAVWQDNDYLASKHIGGLKLIAKDLAFQLNLTKGDSRILVEGTEVTLVLSAYLGQHEGSPKLARIAGKINGNLKMMKNGQEVTLTTEERNQKAQEFLAFYIKQSKIAFSEFVEDFIPVVGNHLIPHAIFDFRLTEDPQFKDDGFELSFVGKFIYDKEGHYKVKDISEVNFIFEEWKKIKREGEETSKNDERYIEKFVVFDDESTPHTSALTAEGSDEAETERKARGCVVLTIKDDFFNSFFEVAVKSGLLDISLTKTQIVHILLFNYSPDNLNINILLEDVFYNVKLNPVYGFKFITFTEGGIEKKFPIGVEYAGLQADYFCFGKGKVLFRNGKFARDVQSLYIEKEADKDYPKILTQELVKGMMLGYTEEIHSLISEPSFCRYVSEFAFHPGSFTLGLDCNA